MRGTKSIVRTYKGDKIIELSEDTYEPLVENIIHRGDLVIMLGAAKANKSTFAMQLACNISSGTPFLGTFAVTTPGKVWYFSTEGKDAEFKERVIRMKKAVPANLDNITLFCSTQFKMNNKLGIDTINEIMETNEDNKPDIIIIDSLYSGFKGSLKDDETVNDFLTIVRGLSEWCNDSAVFITHHTKKRQRDWKGEFVPTSDDDLYGSTFFAGQVDHLLRIEKCRDSANNRMIYCETQRSNRIVEQLKLRLNEPEPFYLSIAEKHDDARDLICRILAKHKKGLKAQDIFAKAEMKTSLGYTVLGELVLLGTVVKIGKWNAIYKLKEA